MSEYRVILDDQNDITTGWGVCDETGGLLYTSENILTKERYTTDTDDARAMLGAGYEAPKPTALEKAHHKPDCLSLALRLERLPCNCGLDAARRQVRAETQA